MYTLRIKDVLTLTMSGALMFLLTGCDLENSNPPVQRNYQLVWEDNFDGAAGSSPDAARWGYDIGTGMDGWGNQELQYYTDRPENVALDGNGNLVITARSENFGGQPYTSARIKTEDIFDQQYGRFEARIKTPFGPGIWPAFWMLSDTCADLGWPTCGEIDIMELRGQEPGTLIGSVHGPGYSGGGAISGKYELEGGRFDADFHVFAIEWGEDFIEFYVDDILYQRLTPEAVPGEWVYDTEFYLILNVAVGGTFVGFPSPEGTRFPQTMTIDYVRVYQEAE